MTAPPRSFLIARAAILGWMLATWFGAAHAATTARRPSAPAQVKLTQPGLFENADAALVAARQAAVRNDSAQLDHAASQVTAHHPLRAYLEYWRLRSQLADDRTGSTDADVQAFIERHDGALVADLARRDWLHALGRRQAWSQVTAVARDLVPPLDAALQCVLWQAQLADGQRSIDHARPILMAPRELADSCQALLRTAFEHSLLDAADRSTRLERALESGSEAALWQAVALTDPELARSRLERALATPLATLQSNPPRTVALVAWTRLARTDPAQAATLLTQRPHSLKPHDQAFIWSQIAARAMQKLLPQAHAWAQNARTATPSDDTLAAMARAALRARDWSAVRHTIERMSPAARNESTWTYWLARSWQADKLRPESQHRARALFTAIASQTDFYGQLAAEELNLPRRIPPNPAPATEAELAAMRAHPGLARALHWYTLGLRPEGNREWSFATRTMSDRELLAAAEFARQQGLLDRAVHAAERTRHEHNFALRYPMPFADRLEPIAHEQGVDPAWIYGLIRQESRFVTDARSVVGATGLMQIMPATGRWIAHKLGTADFHPQRLHDLDTNLQFGTFYLRTVFEKLERSAVLASAAYNAGPGRPRAWQGSLPGPVEGAIFAEIIPFSETRSYVKHVIANTVWYATLRTQRPQSIKAWLGDIAPAPASFATPSPDGE